MADALKLLAVFVMFACFVYTGHAQCSLSNIAILQNKTINFIRGEPEFEIAITSICPCQQSDVQLDVEGFQTTEPVDPEVLDADGFLNGKLPLPSEGVRFKYATSDMFPFRVIGSQVSCS